MLGCMHYNLYYFVHRLTILADDEESDGCRQTVKCILPILPQSAISEGSGSGNGDTIDEYYMFTPEPTNKPETGSTQASIPQKVTNT